MATQFTPGPWGIDGNSLVHGPDERGERRTIAVMRFNWRHNADLIAAAPELYAELQQFVNGVETRMIDSPADETLANITCRAKAALAKARGEQVSA